MGRMKKIIVLLSAVMLVSCKTYDISYDNSQKTEELIKEQQVKGEDKYTLYIVVERSLKGHHLEIEAPAPDQFDPVGERVSYYEGFLPFTDQEPATAIKVNTAGEVLIRLNNTKIVIPASEKVEYRFLYISPYKKRYHLEYSNRKKQYYD
jgi:hypothetical protein